MARKSIEEKKRDRRERVLELKKRGKTYKEIAGILGVSTKTVYNDINAMENQGIIKNKSAEIEYRRNEVLKLKQEGKTCKEIAEILGISSSTVYNDIFMLRNISRKNC